MRGLGLCFGAAGVGLVVAAGCSGSSPSMGCQGTLRCQCYPNGTCNAPLACASDVCVLLSDDSGLSGFPDGQTSSSGGGMSSSGGGVKGPTDAANSGDSPESLGDAGESDTGGPPGNLITNGDFSQGATLWSVVAGTGTPTANNGALCVFVAQGQYAILGWPEPQGTPGPALIPGAMYTFSYIAQATPAVAIDAKVGHSMQPFTPDYETPAGAGDPVTTMFTMFSHTFMAPMSPAETSAGIAFQIPANLSASSVEQVCFRHVSLTQN